MAPWLVAVAVLALATPVRAGQLGAPAGSTDALQPDAARNGAPNGSVLGDALNGNTALPSNTIDPVLDLKRGERDNLAKPDSTVPPNRRTPPANLGSKAELAREPTGQAPAMQGAAGLSLDGGLGSAARGDSAQANRNWSGQTAAGAAPNTTSTIAPGGARPHGPAGASADGNALAGWPSQLAQYLREHRLWVMGSIVGALAALLLGRRFFRRFARRV